MSYTRKELLSAVYERAYQNEAEFGVCPQAVLAALQDYFRFIDDSLIQASHALAGGIARSTDGTCGALNGGLIVISSIYGRKRSEFGEKTGNHEKGEMIARELHDRFAAEFGGVICREVQEKVFGRSYNLRDPREFEKFEADGGHTDKCPLVTGKAARMTAEILLDHGIEPDQG